jgi:hypothetical protein
MVSVVLGLGVGFFHQTYGSFLFGWWTPFSPRDKLRRKRRGIKMMKKTKKRASPRILLRFTWDFMVLE